MQTVYPDYYHKFRCLGGACRHNCCIGWEIDIDDETAAFYRSLDGALGQRLRENIDFDGTPHFILRENDRCPFLDSGGWCELIHTLGEEHLCQVCDRHPRFFNHLPHGIEGGLGLCCEAAGALILGQRTPMKLDGPSHPSLALRDELLDLLCRRDIPLSRRLQQMLKRCSARPPQKPWQSYLKLFLSLERLEEDWGVLLEQTRTLTPAQLTALDTLMLDRQTEYEQFVVYLLYRHFAPAQLTGDTAACAAMIALCSELLRRLGAVVLRQGSFTFDDQVELCRRFSAEIEYSDENIDILYNALQEE